MTFCVRFTCFAQLKQSGERDRLKQLLRRRLEESGWKDDLRARCRGGATVQLLIACWALYLFCLEVQAGVTMDARSQRCTHGCFATLEVKNSCS